MGTYNGQKFLKEQLKSLKEQTYTNWQLYPSDDGSQDNTLPILKEFQKTLGGDRILIFSGPQRGFCANFLSLVCNDSISADYYAYSDQDDIWETDKLERAINTLNKVEPSTPALYCSRSSFINNDHQLLGLSKLFTKKLGFSNALVQCIAGGNTMLFNHAARELLQSVCVNIDVKSHDWWSYLVVTGCGGVVFYDPYPSLKYRQHGHNEIGMNTTWLAKIFRFRQLLQGDYKQWNDKNVVALSLMYTKLTPENQQKFDQFVTARNSWLLPKIYLFLKSGIYRQTLLGNIGLVIAALFNKI